MRFKLIIIVSLLLIASQVRADTPERIHLSWDEVDGASNSIVVMWDTWSNDVTTVEYGTTTAYGLLSSGTTVYSKPGNRYIHTCKLTGLDAQTEYSYRCGSSSGWSKRKTFRTGPEKGSRVDFRFAVNGDCRSNPVERSIILQRTKARNPLFYVFGGDFVNRGSLQSDWDASLNDYTDLISNVAFMTYDANHEGSDPLLFSQFSYPNGWSLDRPYYSFNYDNIHFTCLQVKSEHSVMDSAQYNWMVADLAAAEADPDIDWKIVWFHAPIFADGGHESNKVMRSTVCPVFEQYNVDLCFQAHNHHYGRSKKLHYRNGTYAIVEGGPDYFDSIDGVIYFIVGGGGASISAVSEKSRTAFTAAEHSYVIIDIKNSEGKLYGRVYNMRNKRIDKWSITKPSLVPPAEVP